MSRGDYYKNIPISPENLEKLKRYRSEVAGLEKLPIRCPRCNAIVDMVYVDASGHKDIRCWKCKYLFITSLPYFRTVKNFRRYRDKQTPYRWW